MKGKRLQREQRARREQKELVAASKLETPTGSTFLAGAHLGQPTPANARPLNWTESGKRRTIWLAPSELKDCRAQGGGVAISQTIRKRLEQFALDMAAADEENRRLR